MRVAYRERRAKSAPRLPDAHTLTNALVKSLPFALTRAQRNAHAAISKDLAQPHPMRRLLQGDVGSGKTLVAALAALQAIGNGWQAALMAPTEILAEQHYLKLAHWLEPLGVKIAWLSGSLKARAKKTAIDAIAAGETQLAIGTHALFQEDVAFAKLGLAIVDEQHRFGVEQRLALAAKGEQEPHQLMMSATPIPRTLSMSYFADLDVTVIDELPPGRTPVVTKLVSEERRDEVITRIRESCREGAQAYWVCPLIEESEALQLQTAIETYETMKATFPDLAVGLVHGRPQARGEGADHGGVQGEGDPAPRRDDGDRGGRGRAQRDADGDRARRAHGPRAAAPAARAASGAARSRASRSFCTISRCRRPRGNGLKIIYENNDGFEIARQDLLLRGPGEFLGSRQSGAPLLRFADLERDVDLMEAARNLADELLAAKSPSVLRHLDRWLGTRQFYLKA
jgi:ATP-dependent DNA helicase RecG